MASGKTPTCNLLPADHVLVFPQVNNKEELITRAVGVLCRAVPVLNPAELKAQLLLRESAVSTTLETGLSLPHVRLDEISTFQLVVAVLDKPLKDPASKHSIRAMCLFLSPNKPEFFKAHLQLLSALADTFSPAFIEELALLRAAEIPARVQNAAAAKLRAFEGR